MSLIYQPKGKAREYSPWACNLYNGCTNRCTYCYNRKGVACKLLGKDDVTPKKDASVEQFTKELLKHKEQIIADGKGLFFSFVSDPFLEETWYLNMKCAEVAISNGVKCVFLSKGVLHSSMMKMFSSHKDMVKVGYTLTGCDELEPGAISNKCRIQSIAMLNSIGVKTWASIEPVIDIEKSYNMMTEAYHEGCREFKIGLLSGKKNYTKDQVLDFYNAVCFAFSDCEIYWKDSVMNFISSEETK